MNTKQKCKFLYALVIFTAAYAQGLCQDQAARINYTKFTVSAVAKKAVIDWATDNKIPTNYFEIQRSADGVNFRTVAMVLGPDPTQTNCNCFEYFDKLVKSNKKYFYRLKHVGTDGAVVVSETKLLAINK